MKSDTGYEENVRRMLWNWADRHHQGELDGGKREERPPVLEGKFREKNVLVPPNNESKTRDIRNVIPCNQRHQWFGSLKSSQALTQSVFGALHAFGRLDLLQAGRCACRVWATGLLQKSPWLDARLRARGALFRGKTERENQR